MGDNFVPNGLPSDCRILCSKSKYSKSWLMKLTSQTPSSTSLVPSFCPVSGRTIRANAVHRDLCRNVPHDFDQLARTDLVEEAIELDVLRNGRALAKHLDVVVERLL